MDIAKIPARLPPRSPQRACLYYYKRVFFRVQNAGPSPSLIMPTVPMFDDENNFLLEAHPLQRDFQHDTCEQCVPSLV